jgi:hypothetical protein
MLDGIADEAQPAAAEPDRSDDDPVIAGSLNIGSLRGTAAP